MILQAKGTFDVTLSPATPEPDVDDASIGRLAIAKQFHGDLAAASRGQMLAARSPVEGSAGYVAMEKVIGSLRGRSGSFVLQHSGTMARGAPQLVITVVPDSGTGELSGLAGRMAIAIDAGKHYYDFEYTLAAPA